MHSSILSMHKAVAFKADLAREAALNTSPAPSEPALYYKVHRQAARKTRRNQGWIFVRDLHATPTEMATLIAKFGWTAPRYRVTPYVWVDGQGYVVEEA